jgi:hypothetical protein
MRYSAGTADGHGGERRGLSMADNDSMKNPAPGQDRAAVRELSESECWEVIEDSTFGHLALRSQPVGVDIVPINYIITNRELFFRSGPGAKMEELVAHQHVAFSVERVRGDRWWSVVVKGTTTRLAADLDIENSGVLDLVPTQPGRKSNFVRIRPDTLTGRTFLANS